MFLTYLLGISSKQEYHWGRSLSPETAFETDQTYCFICILSCFQLSRNLHVGVTVSGLISLYRCGTIAEKLVLSISWIFPFFPQFPLQNGLNLLTCVLQLLRDEPSSNSPLTSSVTQKVGSFSLPCLCAPVGCTAATAAQGVSVTSISLLNTAGPLFRPTFCSLLLLLLLSPWD